MCESPHPPSLASGYEIRGRPVPLPHSKRIALSTCKYNEKIPNSKIYRFNPPSRGAKRRISGGKVRHDGARKGRTPRPGMRLSGSGGDRSGAVGLFGRRGDARTCVGVWRLPGGGMQPAVVCLSRRGSAASGRRAGRQPPRRRPDTRETLVCGRSAGCGPDAPPQAGVRILLPQGALPEPLFAGWGPVFGK